MFLNLKIIENYTQALFLNTSHSGNLEQIVEELGIIVNIIDKSKITSIALSSPILNFGDKKILIDILCDKTKSNPLTRNFLYILIKNGRFNLLGEICNLLNKRLIKEKDITEVNIVSASKIKKSDLSFVVKILESKLASKIKIDTNIDSSLIGGISINYKSYIIDCSIKGALERIRSEIL